MIRINLLPFRAARKKENIQRQLSIFAMVLVLMLVGMGAVVIHLDGKISTRKERLDSMKSELVQLQKKQKQVVKLQKELKLLDQKLQIMDALEHGRRVPVDLFEKLTETVVSKQMWLSSFNASSKAVRISGTALDDKVVAQFMKNLEGTGLFSAINLQSVKQTQQAGVSMRNFSLDCPRKSPEPIVSQKGGRKK